MATLTEIQEALAEVAVEMLLPLVDEIAREPCPDGVAYADHRAEGIERALAVTLAALVGGHERSFKLQVISRAQLVQDEGMEYLALPPSITETFRSRFSELRALYRNPNSD